jgi:hypothetical protein
MTYALRGARSLTGHALAAPIAWIIALTALAALGLSGMPFHEPFHARGSYPATVRKPHCRYSFGLVLGPAPASSSRRPASMPTLREFSNAWQRMQAYSTAETW